MSIIAFVAALLLLLCALLVLRLCRAGRCAGAEKARGIERRAVPVRIRPRHLSPHRAAIERLKGKEAARGRR